MAFDFPFNGFEPKCWRKIFLLKLWLLTMWCLYLCSLHLCMNWSRKFPCASVKKLYTEMGHRGVSGWIWPLPCRPCQNGGMATVPGSQCQCYCRPTTLVRAEQGVLWGSSRSVCCIYGGHFPSWPLRLCFFMDIGSPIRLWIWLSLSMPPQIVAMGQGPLLSHWFYLGVKKCWTFSVSDSLWSRGL